MSHRLLLVFLASSLVACSSTPPGPGPSACEISTPVTLPASTLSTDDYLRIQRAGDGFLLASTWFGDDLRTPLARSSRLGELGPIAEPSEGGTPSYLGLAAVGKDGAADQIVAVEQGPHPGGGTNVVAGVLDEETGLPGPVHEVLDLGTFGQIIQRSMASSLDGRRAIYAHGNRGAEDPHVAVLGGDAERRGAPIVVNTGPDHDWGCLAVVPTSSAAAVSVMEERDGGRFWHLIELDAEGAKIFEASVDVTDEPSDHAIGCVGPVVTRDGFALLLKATGAPPLVVAVDRATFADDGATFVSLGDVQEPDARAEALAAMRGGYAVYFGNGSGGSKPIRFFDASGQAVPGGLDLPAGVTIGARIRSAPGSLLLSSRSDDARWGWLEAICAE